MASLRSNFCDDEVVTRCRKSEFKLSVLKRQEAEKLFSEFGSMKGLAKDYPLDGCYARALKQAKLAESKGIIVGKIFILGVLRPQGKAPRVNPLSLVKGHKYDMFWGWHVAPVILVENKQGKVEPMVMDPLVADRPLSVPEMKKRLMSEGMPKSRITEVYFGNRYQYQPKHSKSLAGTSWSDEDEKDADETLQKYEGFMAANKQSIMQYLDYSKSVLPPDKAEPADALPLDLTPADTVPEGPVPEETDVFQ